VISSPKAVHVAVAVHDHVNDEARTATLTLT